MELILLLSLGFFFELYDLLFRRTIPPCYAAPSQTRSSVLRFIAAGGCPGLGIGSVTIDVAASLPAARAPS